MSVMWLSREENSRRFYADHLPQLPWLIEHMEIREAKLERDLEELRADLADARATLGAAPSPAPTKQAGAAVTREGWLRPRGARRWHYFRDSRSLCGRWFTLCDDLVHECDKRPDNCMECQWKRGRVAAPNDKETT